MKENLVLETGVSSQKGKEIFWDIFCLWKSYYAVSEEEIESCVEWLEAIIDKRINAIVSGKYRRKYEDVALLAAALGEVKESLGFESAKWDILNEYLARYPKHRAFREALREYMGK